MGRMCFWNGTTDAFRIFLENCFLIGDHLDQTNIKDGMSLIVLIFLCSYVNEKREETLQYTMTSIQLVDT